MPGPNAAGSLACSVSIRFYNYVSILEQCPLSEDTHWLQTLPTGPAHLIPWNFRMTWKKIQGLAETLAAWKVSQNPRSSQHHDELIFFSERGKEKKHQVYSKLGGKRASRLLHAPRGQLSGVSLRAICSGDRINSPWIVSRFPQGPFRTLLGTKVRKGVSIVAGAHAGKLPLTGKSSLQIFMTSK